ncbi:MAG: Hsp70 family protein, partial [Janthinobacterium lividum]
NELGFPLNAAVGRLKRELSSADTAQFQFAGAGLEIDRTVTRAEFEGWIATDVARIAVTVDRALVAAGTGEKAIDRVFLTGGTSLVPAVRALFSDRFGEHRIESGGELTSIAHGLALIAAEDDPSPWTV